MRFLLTNDDGIYARGLGALYQELSKDADCIVVAPEVEQSAVGHAITISRPLMVRQAAGKTASSWAGPWPGRLQTASRSVCVSLRTSLSIWSCRGSTSGPTWESTSFIPGPSPPRRKVRSWGSPPSPSRSGRTAATPISASPPVLPGRWRNSCSITTRTGTSR